MSLVKVWLVKYKNYYSRSAKRSETLSGYISAGSYFQWDNVNFNPNNGIYASVVVNCPSDFACDYCVITRTGATAGSTPIISRWFVIENQFNRDGQSIISLKRDVVADYWNNIQNENFFCRRGTPELSGIGSDSPSDINAYALQKEGALANQIRKDLVFYPQNSNNLAWIIGFISTDSRFTLKSRYISQLDGEEKEKTVGFIFGDTYIARSYVLSQSNITIGFSMFAIPFIIPGAPQTTINIISKGIGGSASFDTAGAFKAANIISQNLSGSGALWDIQIVPYIPKIYGNVSIEVSGSNINITAENFPEKVVPSDLSGSTFNSYRYGILIDTMAGDLDPSTFIKNNVVGGFYLSSNIVEDFSPTSVIRYDEDGNIKNGFLYIGPGSYDKDDLLKLKEINEFDFYRIISRGGGNCYEFGVADSGIDMFTISRIKIRAFYSPGCCYYTLKIQTNNSLLPKREFYDHNGLKYSDYSPVLQQSDRYLTFMLNNSTYFESFKSSINHANITNEMALQYAGIHAALGAVSSAMSGATSGAMVGGGVGAVAGAAVGGIAGAVGGVLDIEYQRKMNAENIRYQTEQFNLSTRAIKSAPDTLISSPNDLISSSLFPCAEYYTTTDSEKEAFRKYLVQNAASLNYYDTFSNFVERASDDFSRFISGKFPRLESIHDDFHIIDVINEELERGVYIE